MAKSEMDEFAKLFEKSSHPLLRVDSWIPTMCTPLDKILGNGIPIGRITEIYGDASTGKSLIAAQVAASAQLDDIPVVYMDSEHAISTTILEAVGVDIDDPSFVYYSPASVEEVFSIIEDSIERKTKVFGAEYPLLIVWDSIASTSIASEIENEVGKATMGRHAAMISQGLRKDIDKLASNGVAALFLNQTRQKIGVMFGDNETTFGGRAVEFYASVRLRLKMGKKIRDKDRTIVGIFTYATVTKNKVAVPFGEATLPIYFGSGIDDAESTLEFLKQRGYTTTSGSWYSIELSGEEQKFQRSGWVDVYDEHFDEIAKIVMES